MHLLTNIACKTVGIAGAGMALYDAVQIGKIESRRQAQVSQANYLEKIYFNSRTVETNSVIANKTREKTYNFISKNPLPVIWGRIKGWFKGSLYSLGNSLPLVICSTMALLGKNYVAKAGVVGSALCAGYSIARNGFGLGKTNPMN